MLSTLLNVTGLRIGLTAQEHISSASPIIVLRSRVLCIAIPTQVLEALLYPQRGDMTPMAAPKQGRPAIALLLAGAAVAAFVTLAPASTPSAFVAPQLPSAQGLTVGSAVGSRVAVNTRTWPWVEPTIPEELVAEAKDEGFALRPKYNHAKIGYVISDCNTKTRVAHVEYFLFNAKYGAYYKKSKKFHFHDEYETAQLGDVVMIAPYRRRSKMKHYRLIEVLKKNDTPIRV
jgi:small subunit ribosomal protein S17